MFDSQRHLTKGINANIGIDLQMLMWAMIDSQKSQGKKMDYLQVFELSRVRMDDKLVQKVIQKQEVPLRKEEGLYTIEEPVSIKVWIIDSGAYCMMLLPEEY